MHALPAVSVLIPNFNNGPSSTRSGRDDLLGDLLASLEQTLEDDPTPLEIIIADDGSTDGSLETCRTWARRAWSGGQRRGEPFCRLIELEHCGVLSRVANRLTAEARGPICCRLDGDVVVHTPRWAQAIVAAFTAGPPDLGVIGPLQLGLDGRVHSAGSWILHPRGHHHVAQGADATALPRAIEVDHVMGCFYCHRRAIWEELGGYDEDYLRGQTVDFGLRARRAGWRAWCVPSVRFTHRHALRVVRANRADTDSGIEQSLETFRAKWGFDRLAADLDVVAERYAGTGLLWNASVFGPTAAPAGSEKPIDPARSEWGRYAADAAVQAAVHQRLAVVETLAARGLPPSPRLVQVRSRGGLLCHLLAERGARCTGVDEDGRHVQLARAVTARRQYPAASPQFVVQPERRHLPLEDGSADGVLLLDVLDRHHNPVGLLREVWRALAPDGLVAIIVRERRGMFDDDGGATHPYRAHELVLQLQATGLFAPEVDESVQAPGGTLVVFGRRRSKAGTLVMEKQSRETIGV